MNKKYDPKFKREAINLVLHSEQTYRQTANDLGINYKTFCNWMYQMMNKPTHQAIKLNKKPDYQELERQNKAMKKELELRKKEIEILKKAAQYFASQNELPTFQWRVILKLSHHLFFKLNG